MPCNSKSLLAVAADAAVAGVDAEVVEADVAVAEEVPRVPVEGFPPRREPHVQLVAARALGRASAAASRPSAPTREHSAEPGGGQAAASRPAGKSPVRRTGWRPHR